MTYPAYDTSGIADAAESHTGPVTCASCGCLLTPAEDGRQGWLHFAPINGRDARGCRVACADRVHDDTGHTATR